MYILKRKMDAFFSHRNKISNLPIVLYLLNLEKVSR